jgi:phenylacetate-CoA ligase
MADFLTSVPAITWPALPQPYPAGLLAVLFQLERSQWLSPDELRHQQFGQLRHVVRYAYEAVPYYRQTFDAAKIDPQTTVSPEGWQQLPLLTRRDVQTTGNQLHSTTMATSRQRPQVARRMPRW